MRYTKVKSNGKVTLDAKTMEDSIHISFFQKTIDREIGRSNVLRCVVKRLKELEDLNEKKPPTIYTNSMPYGPTHYYHCPSCDRWMMFKVDHCSHCGQAIDWNDESDEQGEMQD